VHGIPSPKRELRAGDILSIDVGVKYQGYYTDGAVTVPVGDVPKESARLLAVTQEALSAGISAATPGNHLGDIGAAISGVVSRARLSLAKDLVGHGVGLEPHEEPQVPNEGKPKRGTKLVPGLTIAIEPMVNLGVAATRTLSRPVDGGDRGRQAVGALRAYRRHHGRRTADPDGGVDAAGSAYRCFSTSSVAIDAAWVVAPTRRSASSASPRPSAGSVRPATLIRTL